MSEREEEGNGLARHGASRLPSVDVESYNIEIQDEDGFIGDKANKSAFLDFLATAKDMHAETGSTAEKDDQDMSKRKIDAMLTEGTPSEAGVVHSAIEEFAQQLSAITRRYRKGKAWKDVETVVVGGGFRASRAGEIAIHRANIILRSQDDSIDMRPITHDPQEAGLIGCAHLAPSWIFEAYDNILAVDIGGSNIRCGLLDLHQDDAPDLSKAAISKTHRWKHGEESPSRDDAIDRLGEMLNSLIGAARKRRLAPFIGIGCPGMIGEDASIERGAQNLPGNWESSRFNLVREVKSLIPKIGDHETLVVLHNDAVVQGLSERPFLDGVEKWAVLTIGTGLGNASFRNRSIAR